MSTYKSVFITGANGFIGRHLAERFKAQGAVVSGLDIGADAANSVVAGDVGVASSWQDALAGCDLVIHTAAVVSMRGDHEKFWRTNVLGTRNVIEAAARHGAKRFVQFSSVAAFSSVFPDGVSEDHPIHTDDNPYTNTKVASEQVVLQAHAAGEVDCTIIRPGDVYGPGSRPWTIEPLGLIKKHQMILPTMGRGIFSPIFITNLIDGVVLAAESPAGSGQVFTLSDGVGVTTQDFFGRYARMLGRKGVPAVPTSLLKLLAGASYKLSGVLPLNPELNVGTVEFLDRRGTYSIEKARAVLGFNPEIGLDEGFAITEKWLRDEGYLG
ncbi:MAG: NAD-dependent epimerase/dehydratase family protein [Thermoleophilaceae bacterium]|nr:NAD-dependent epimerase/dehydratase family protein [Thermoleophilaceae bacterium]